MSENVVHGELKNGMIIICYRCKMEDSNIGVTKNELVYNLDTIPKSNIKTSTTTVLR